MWRFSLFGIPVTVQPFFWLTMALIGAGRMGGDMRQQTLNLLWFALAGFISILVHEFGHALTARKFGARVEVVLHGFGGYAAYSGAAFSRAKHFAITAAGPVVQLLLGCMAFLVLKQLGGKMNHNGLLFFHHLWWVSVAWAVLNLLPVLPMDGGRLVESVLGPRRIRATLIVSLLTGVLVGAGALMIGQPFLAVFMLVFGYQSFQALRQLPR